ncbi:MAG: poly-gamma-glutamate biosynthesis protein PgsC [Alkalispirochaeta sp.]
MDVELYLVIGVVLSIIFTELTLISPGGVIVPGYIALVWNDPLRVAATLVVAMVTLLLLRLLDRVVILYGRRRFAAAIVLSFAVRGLLDLTIPAPALVADIAEGVTVATQFTAGITGAAAKGTTVIGWLVPAIIAVDMDRQGPGITIASMAGVSALVRLLGAMWGG